MTQLQLGICAKAGRVGSSSRFHQNGTYIPAINEDTVTKDKRTENLKPWPKGVSGNPAGKTKGVRNRSTIVRELLEAKATDGLPGCVVDQLVRAMVMKAGKGDVAAFRELMDSAYGKVKDESEALIQYTLMPTLRIGGKEVVFNVGKPAN